MLPIDVYGRLFAKTTMAISISAPEQGRLLNES